MLNLNGILNKCGLSNISLLQNGDYPKGLVAAVKYRLSDQLKQTWLRKLKTHNAYRFELLEI